MKKLTALILCLCTVLTLFSGCDQPDTEPHTPTGDALVMEGQDPDSIGPQVEEEPQELSLCYYPNRSMNPLTCTDYTNRVLFSLIYQSLFNVDAELNVEPILCSKFQVSPDGRTWTFHIEPNATFSDGSSVTINDVLATYQAAQKSTYYSGRFTHVTDISLTGDGGIAFKLSTAYENLPQLLDVPILKSTQVESECPLGSGPYALSNSLAGAHLRRVLTWWCQGVETVVTAESIPLVEAKDAAHIRDQFEFYDVGLVCADPCSDLYADFRCDFELWDIDNGIFLFLACNVQYAECMEDTTLRSMLTYAIDRETIVQTHFDGYALASTLAASPASPYYRKSLASKYAYDPMKFVNFLATFGKTEEPLRLLVNSDDSVRLTIAHEIADALTEFGLPTQVMEKSSAGFQQEIYNGNYDLYLGKTRLSSNYDLSPFFKPYGNMAKNGVADQVTYALCLESLANQGNYYNLLRQVADDARIIPIAFYGYAVYATRGLLTDLTPARDNIFYYSLGKTMDGIQVPTEYN